MRTAKHSLQAHLLRSLQERIMATKESAGWYLHVSAR